MNKFTQAALAAALAAAMAGCSSGGTATDGGAGGGSGGTGGGASGAFTQPANTVAVNFSVDDSANKVFKAGELEWKGAHKFDATTRKTTLDSTWSGPYPKLYDDGPWSAGGHEPAGSTAGDSKWGVTVFATPPATGVDAYGYGLIDATSTADGWIWRGPDGSYSVAAGATAAINAAGLTLPKFGTTDLKLVLDTAALPTTTADGGTVTWAKTKVEVKGSGWAWTPVELKDDGLKGDDTAADNKFTFVLSEQVGAGKQFPHSGLVGSGDAPEFVFMLTGVEYKDLGVALKTGVTGFLKPAGGAFAPATINIANKNTNVVVP